VYRRWVPYKETIHTLLQGTHKNSFRCCPREQLYVTKTTLKPLK
jgi:hypothetical protein